jgi:hypothetical protein
MAAFRFLHCLKSGLSRRAIHFVVPFPDQKIERARGQDSYEA